MAGPVWRRVLWYAIHEKAPRTGAGLCALHAVPFRHLAILGLAQHPANRRTDLLGRAVTDVNNQRPPARSCPRTPPAQHVDELQELVRLCEQGRVCEVEHWVRKGLPLHLAPGLQVHGRLRSPLQIALRTGQHSLTLLLLRTGCVPDADRSSPFDTALQARRSDLVDRLFQFGADPRRVDLETLLDTYDSALYERFLSAGVDLTQNHALVAALAYHPGNKLLIGFAKHHRNSCPAIQSELDIALEYQAREDGDKGVMQCL